MRLGQSFFADMTEHGVFDYDNAASALSEAAPVSVEHQAVVGDETSSSFAGRDFRTWGGGRPWKPKPGGTEPPPPGPNSKKFADETRKEVELLQDAVDR